MNDVPLGTLFWLLGLLLLLSAFFSSTETALMSINRYRLRHRARAGQRAARLAEALLKRPDRLIGLILLGNNFANIFASSLVTLIALRIGGEGAIAIGAGLLTLALFSGLMFLQDIFAQHLLHKTVLSLIAWAVFAILLLGRLKLGWRGRQAVHWVLAGYGLLALSYFGSRFVLEFILGRQGG